MTGRFNQFISQILARETAAAGVADATIIPLDPQLDYLRLALTRADAILDRRRNAVFMDILNVPNKAAAQRVALAYDPSFFLGLGLSIDTTIELVRELIAILARMGVQYPNSWDLLAAGVLDSLEEDEPVEIPTIRPSPIQ